MQETDKIKFNKSYNYSFSFFYLVQGLHDGIQGIVLPIFLMGLVEDLDLTLILLVLSVTALPWSFKFFIGLLNDKYGSEKYGRRKPWIIIFGAFSGFWWIMLGVLLPSAIDVIFITTLCVFLFNLGLAVADTSVDGLILDITPREKLGKVQSSTWTCYLLGSMTGGILLGLLFTALSSIYLLFILEGILMILACGTMYYIQDEFIPEDVHVWKGLKEIISKRKNWKVFGSTFIASFSKNIVPLLFGLLILLSVGALHTEVISLSIASSSLDLIFLFGIISAIVGIGVAMGCIIGGKISDKNRRQSVLIANLILIPVFLLCFLSYYNFIFAILMMILLGFGQGAVRTSYQVIRSDLAQQYPELNATYYALVISFLNGGLTIGYSLAGMVLVFFTETLLITEFLIIFFWIMIIFSGFQMCALLIFLTISREEYELKAISKE